VNVDKGELAARGDRTTYIVEKATAVIKKASFPMVVFCVDMSGSMSTNVKTSDASKYFSRMQCVKMAVKSQIATLRDSQPDCVAVVIGFNSDVHIYGDGTSRVEQLTGRILSSTQMLVEKGDAIRNSLCRVGVGKSAGYLLDKVEAMDDGGSTALGPALAVAVGIASIHPGAKIMVCTDGAANSGVGDVNADPKFYKEIAQIARQKAVSISVITMEGEDCSLENLGTAADITNGNVEIVDPAQMSSKVIQMFNKAILGTKVQSKLVLPNILVPRPLNDAEASPIRELNSVDVESDITYSFDFSAPAFSLLKDYFHTKKFDEDRPPKPQFVDGIPFQLQITYTNNTGDKLLKVFNAVKSVTEERQKAEADTNTTACALQVLHESARLAQRGDYLSARANLVSTQRLLQRCMHNAQSVRNQTDYLSFIVQAEKLDQFMREAQTQNQVFGAQDPTKARDDAASKAMYQMKSVSVKAFNERRA